MSSNWYWFRPFRVHTECPLIDCKLGSDSNRFTKFYFPNFRLVSTFAEAETDTSLPNPVKFTYDITNLWGQFG